jgi:hypothetical protein
LLTRIKQPKKENKPEVNRFNNFLDELVFASMQHKVVMSSSKCGVWQAKRIFPTRAPPPLQMQKVSSNKITIKIYSPHLFSFVTACFYGAN